jgi:hypothetical protein
MVDPEHDEPGVEIVGHVLARMRERVDTREVAHLAQVTAEALVQFLGDLVRIALELLARSSASLVTVGCVEYQ